METQTGIILHLNTKRAFGFIAAEDGEQLFFHKSGVISPGFENLKTGLPVEFFATTDPDGRRKAIGVVVV